MNDIPEGYSLTITSWENDADCYKKQVFNGLSYEDVLFLVELASLFKSMNNHSDPGFGGGGWHWKNGEENYYSDVYAAIDTVVKKYEGVNVNPELYGQWASLREEADVDEEYGDDGYNEMISELVGYPECDGYSSSYIRVFDSFKVHYYESKVKDVTNNFSPEAIKKALNEI